MKYEFTVNEGAFQGKSYFYFGCESAVELVGHYPYRNGTVAVEFNSLEEEVAKSKYARPVTKLKAKGCDNLVCLFVPFVEPTALDMGTHYFFKADAPIKAEGHYLGERASLAYLTEERFEKFLAMAEDNKLRNTRKTD